MEDYPPRGFIVGGHFVSPEGANISPSLYAPSRVLHLKKILPAAPFSFFATQKKGSLSDFVV